MHGLPTGQDPASSSTRCSPAAGTPTTSTSRSSATATPTPSSDPTTSHRARRPRRCGRSLPATKRRSPPAPAARAQPPSGPAVPRRPRYPDGLHLAAEQPVGPQAVADLDHIDQHIPGLTAEPAWPTLRTHLIALSAETGDHPYRHLKEAARSRDLSTVVDMAAVLDWRLPALANQDDGPLPWIPGVPTRLQDHPIWGSYLAHRCQLVANLADLIKSGTTLADADPSWAPLDSRLSDNLLSEVAVWRAANGIEPSDPRPTGGPQSKQSHPAGRTNLTAPSPIPWVRRGP